MENSTLTDTQNSPVWSVGGERDRAWQCRLPIKVEQNVYFEPHLEVDSEVEPKTVAIQETGNL